MTGENRTVYRVVSAEICRNGRYLITQRSMRAVLPLLWEFPGGRVREGQSDSEVLRENLKLRIGVDPNVGPLVMEVTHEYFGYDLVMCVYKCEIGDQEPDVRMANDLAWITPEQFSEYTFPGADQKTIDALLSGD